MSPRCVRKAAQGQFADAHRAHGEAVKRQQRTSRVPEWPGDTPFAVSKPNSLPNKAHGDRPYSQVYRFLLELDRVALCWDGGIAICEGRAIVG